MTAVLDRSKQKIASFRTNEGEWADFAAYAQKNGFTATDILKSAMSQYLAGSFDPVGTSVSTPTQAIDQIEEIVNAAVSTAIERLDLDRSVSASVNTAVSTAIEPLRLLMSAEYIDNRVNDALRSADIIDADRVMLRIDRVVDAESALLRAQIDRLCQRIEQIEHLNPAAPPPPLGAKAPKPLSTPQTIPADLDTASGLSHAQLAKLLNKNSSTLSRWATGKRQIPSDIAAKWIFADGKWYPLNSIAPNNLDIGL
jgi:hypothetical protein